LAKKTTKKIEDKLLEEKPPIGSLLVDRRRLREVRLYDGRNEEEYAERKALMQRTNRVVKTPIARIGSSVLKSPGSGLKKKYTPTRMKNSINKYFSQCEVRDEVPNVKGLMIYLEMYRDMFYKYKAYPGFTDLMTHTQMIISNWVESDIYNTPGQAAGKLAYAKNILDWTEKIETKSEVVQTVLSVSEARGKIAMLAPKLLELLGSQELVSQIVAGKVVEADVVEESK